VRSRAIAVGFISRDRAVIGSCIFLVTALAWLYLFRVNDAMSAAASDSVMTRMGMTVDAPWTARDFIFTFAMWAVMMVGMMLPSAAPVVLLFTKMRSSSGDAHSSMTGALFAVTYLIVWVGFSLAAVLLQWGLHSAMLLSPEMAVTSSRVGGLLLIAAGAYQLSPTKAACLTRCQSPLGFLLTNWREGAAGALQLGLRHGAYCLGCCWALMLVLFVVGVMNLAWIAALMVFILLEKLGPVGARIARAGGVAIILAGMFLVVS
jgi:predicted metal-binding membrane protein